MRLLTMVPKSWTSRKIEKEFEVTYSLARKAHDLHNETGIGSSPNPPIGKSLPQDTMNLLNQFYFDSDIRRLLPGKNDYVSCVKNGVRAHVQKRLLLSYQRNAF